MSVGNFVLVILVVLIIYVIYLGIKIVPQSKVFVIERFGKFTRILDSGLSIIVPFVDNVAHRVDILERQLPAFTISVITEDMLRSVYHQLFFFELSMLQNLFIELRTLILQFKILQFQLFVQLQVN